MAQLRDVLRKLHWEAYESSVYDVLMKEGPLKANEISLKTKVPSGRIYDVLGSLEKKGYVRRRGKRPAIYDASHPRSVIEKELRSLEGEAKEAIATAEQAWEVRREKHETGLENAWTTGGLFGVVAEFRRLVVNSRNVLVADPNIEWIQRQDIEALSKSSSQGDVRILSSSSSKEVLERLKREKLNVRMVEPFQEAFYVFDGRKSLLRMNSPDAAVILDSKPLAEIMKNRFEELFKRSKDIEARRA